MINNPRTEKYLLIRFNKFCSVFLIVPFKFTKVNIRREI